LKGPSTYKTRLIDIIEVLKQVCRTKAGSVSRIG